MARDGLLLSEVPLIAMMSVNPRSSLKGCFKGHSETQQYCRDWGPSFLIQHHLQCRELQTVLNIEEHALDHTVILIGFYVIFLNYELLEALGAVGPPQFRTFIF